MKRNEIMKIVDQNHEEKRNHEDSRSKSCYFIRICIFSHTLNKNYRFLFKSVLKYILFYTDLMSSLYS